MTQASAPTNTVPYIGIVNIGKALLIPSKIHRFVTCNDHTYRSRVFVRPCLIVIKFVRHSPVGNEGLWLLHLSDHSAEITGAQYRLDRSQAPGEVMAALLKRCKKCRKLHRKRI